MVATGKKSRKKIENSIKSSFSRFSPQKQSWASHFRQSCKQKNPHMNSLIFSSESLFEKEEKKIFRGFFKNRCEPKKKTRFRMNFEKARWKKKFSNKKTQNLVSYQFLKKSEIFCLFLLIFLHLKVNEDAKRVFHKSRKMFYCIFRTKQILELISQALIEIMECKLKLYNHKSIELHRAKSGGISAIGIPHHLLIYQLWGSVKATHVGEAIVNVFDIKSQRETFECLREIWILIRMQCTWMDWESIVSMTRWMDEWMNECVKEVWMTFLSFNWGLSFDGIM